jgi:hypothetical protein
MTHTLDKVKMEAELFKRGWKYSEYKNWLVPNTATWKTIEEDWTAAVLAGIICEIEQKKEETKEFFKKHPTPKR